MAALQVPLRTNTCAVPQATSFNAKPIKHTNQQRLSCATLIWLFEYSVAGVYGQTGKPQLNANTERSVQASGEEIKLWQTKKPFEVIHLGSSAPPSNVKQSQSSAHIHTVAFLRLSEIQFMIIIIISCSFRTVLYWRLRCAYRIHFYTFCSRTIFMSSFHYNKRNILFGILIIHSLCKYILRSQTAHICATHPRIYCGVV